MQDSNLRRQCHQIYSLTPLTARETPLSGGLWTPPDLSGACAGGDGRVFGIASVSVDARTSLANRFRAGPRDPTAARAPAEASRPHDALDRLCRATAVMVS